MKTFLQILIFIPFALNAQTSDWITISSAYSSQQTVETLQKEIQQKGFKLFATINHSQEAKAAGLKLRPTVLLILGNPKAGTALMNCDLKISIDLPLKILVWEDSNGGTKAGFINPESFLKEYNLTNCKEVLPKMKAALQELLASVAKKN
jgi:uncharacterized protein (DUF302 family)